MEEIYYFINCLFVFCFRLWSQLFFYTIVYDNFCVRTIIIILTKFIVTINKDLCYSTFFLNGIVVKFLAFYLNVSKSSTFETIFNYTVIATNYHFR